MKKRRLSIKLLLLLTIACVSSGIYIKYKYLNPVRTTEAKSVPTNNISPKRVITNETIVQQIQKKQELITLEADLSADLTIDDSWGELSLFRKMQTVHFYGKGLYAVDLANIPKENIVVNNEKRIINVGIPKPFIKAIYIEQDNTVFGTPLNGAFRFGDIKLTPEEFEFMLGEAKGKMKEKLSSDILFKQALVNSEVSISKLLISFLDKDNIYDINVTTIQ